MSDRRPLPAAPFAAAPIALSVLGAAALAMAAVRGALDGADGADGAAPPGARALAGEAPPLQRLLDLPAVERSDGESAAGGADSLETVLRRAFVPRFVDEFDAPAGVAAEWISGRDLAALPAAPRRAGFEPFAVEGLRGIAVVPGEGGLVRDFAMSPGDCILVRARVKPLEAAPRDAALQLEPLADLRPNGAASRKLRIGPLFRRLPMRAPIAAGDDWQELELLMPPQPGLHGVRVALQPGGCGLAIDRVELIEVPPSFATLAEVRRPGEPWSGQSGRRALQVGAVRADGVLLAGGATLAVELQLPARAPRFEALLAPLGGDASPERAVELWIDGKSFASCPLPHDLDLPTTGAPRNTVTARASGDTAAFFEWRVDLAAHAGRRVRLELRPRGRDSVLFVGAPLLVGAAPPTTPPTTPSTTPHPPSAARNLILLSIDTLRGDQLHCDGHPVARTPTIDRLAAAGTRFTNLHTASSWTLPSHASLLTGLPPLAHGCYLPERRVPERVQLLAEQFAAHGFSTAAFTGGGFLDADFGFAAGFERFSRRDPGIGPFVDAAGTRAAPIDPALEWIAARRDVPFFLLLHTYAVHNYLPEPEYAAREPSLAGFDLAQVPALIARATADDASALPLLESLYGATLRQVDAELVAPLLATLERLGLADSTVVALTSDHGEQWFAHGRAFHGEQLWSELTRVPWIVRGPGFAAGAVDDQLAAHVDVAPTLMARLGVPRFELSTGRDLLAPRADAADAAPPMATQHVRSVPHGLQDGLVAWPWKLVRRRAREGAAPVDALYHLGRDPGERDDCAAREPERVAQLARLLETRLAEYELLRKALGGDAAGGELQLDPALEAELRALGYLEDSK
ncbi:MAG: sulfatase [Planctomycetes bacterium]|nr:sulfatase [Planctomycetota bacterium]